MDDIASLGFSIDSTQALQAQLALDAMARSAQEAQRQQQIMMQLAQEQNSKLGDLNRTLGDHQRQLQSASDTAALHAASLQKIGLAAAEVNTQLATLHERIQGISTGKIDDAVAAWSRLRDMASAIGTNRSGYLNFANSTGDINGGIPAETQVSIISRLTQAISDQGTIGTSIRGAISGVGVNATSYASGQEAELFRDISSALNDLTDSYSKAQKAQQIFGQATVETMNAIMVNGRALSAQEKDALAIEELLATRRADKTMSDFQGSRDNGDAANKRLSQARSALSSANFGRDAGTFGSAATDYLNSLVFKSGDRDANSQSLTDSIIPLIKSISGYLTQASLSILPYSAQTNSNSTDMLQSMGLGAPTQRTQIGGPENYTVQTFQNSINTRKNMQENWFTWSAAKEKEQWDYAYQAAVDGGQKNNAILEQIDEQRTQAARAAAMERRQISDIEFQDSLSSISSNPYAVLNAQGQRLTDFNTTRNPIEIANQKATVNREARNAQDYTSNAFYSINRGNITGNAAIQSSLDQSQVSTAQLAEKAGIISTVSRQTIELAAAQDAYNAKLAEANLLEQQANDPNSAVGRDPQKQAQQLQQAKLISAQAQVDLENKKQSIALEIPMEDKRKELDDKRQASIDAVAEKYASASAEVRKYYTDVAGAQFDVGLQTPGDKTRQSNAARLLNQRLGSNLENNLLGQNSSLTGSNRGIGFQIQSANQGPLATEATQIQYENDLLRIQAQLIEDPKKKQSVLDLIAAHQNLQTEQSKLNASLQAEQQIRQNGKDIQDLEYELSLTGKSADERQRLVDLKKESQRLDDLNIDPSQKRTLLNQTEDKGLKEQKLRDLQKEEQLQQQVMVNGLQSVQNNFSQFFQNINTGASSSWKTMGSSLVQTFNKTLADMEAALIARPLIGAFLRLLGGDDFARQMGFGGGTGGGVALPTGGLIGNLFGPSDTAYGGFLGQGGTSYASAFAGGTIAMAKGGAFYNGTRFLASGDILDSATPFTDMGGTRLNVAGEAGSEAVMPLTRGPDGNLGVRSHGAGGSVYIDARGSQAGVEQRIRAVLAQERPSIIQQSTNASIAAVRFHADSGGPFALTVGRRRR